MVRMSAAANRRQREEWLMLAEVIMVGVAAGMSGKIDPVNSLAKALGLPPPGGGSAPGAKSGGVTDNVTALYGRLRVGAHGSNGR